MNTTELSVSKASPPSLFSELAQVRMPVGRLDGLTTGLKEIASSHGIDLPEGLTLAQTFKELDSRLKDQIVAATNNVSALRQTLGVIAQIRNYVVTFDQTDGLISTQSHLIYEVALNHCWVSSFDHHSTVIESMWRAGHLVDKLLPQLVEDVINTINEPHYGHAGHKCISLLIKMGQFEQYRAALLTGLRTTERDSLLAGAARDYLKQANFVDAIACADQISAVYQVYQRKITFQQVAHAMHAAGQDPAPALTCLEACNQEGVYILPSGKLNQALVGDLIDMEQYSRLDKILDKLTDPSERSWITTGILTKIIERRQIPDALTEIARRRALLNPEDSILVDVALWAKKVSPHESEVHRVAAYRDLEELIDRVKTLKATSKRISAFQTLTRALSQDKYINFALEVVGNISDRIIRFEESMRIMTQPGLTAEQIKASYTATYRTWCDFKDPALRLDFLPKLIGAVGLINRNNDAIALNLEALGDQAIQLISHKKVLSASARQFAVVFANAGDLEQAKRFLTLVYPKDITASQLEVLAAYLKLPDRDLDQAWEFARKMEGGGQNRYARELGTLSVVEHGLKEHGFDWTHGHLSEVTDQFTWSLANLARSQAYRTGAAPNLNQAKRIETRALTLSAGLPPMAKKIFDEYHVSTLIETGRLDLALGITRDVSFDPTARVSCQAMIGRLSTPRALWRGEPDAPEYNFWDRLPYLVV